MSNTTIIILASGGGSRFQGIKQLADIDGIPMVRRVCQNAIASNCKDVVLVLGAYHEQIIPIVQDLDVHIVINQEWENGMSGSIQKAINYVEMHSSDTTSVLITLGDLPYILPKDFNQLLTMSTMNSDKTIASQYQCVIGVPAIFAKSQWAVLKALTGDRGARDILRASKNVKTISLSTAGNDVDTSSDISAH